jgi:hypothetical protein
LTLPRGGGVTVEGGIILRVTMHGIFKSWCFVGKVLFDNVQDLVHIGINPFSGAFRVPDTLIELLIELILLRESLLNW